MKYYIEEITVLKSGQSAVAITEKDSKDSAISAYHQAMASAIINPNVESIHAEAKNSLGGVYAAETWEAPVPEPTPEIPDEPEVTE